MHPNRPGYKYFGAGLMGELAAVAPHCPTRMDTLLREIARNAAAPNQAWVGVLPLARLRSGAMPVLRTLLDEDERNRATAFHFEKDALAYAAAHALLRWSLSVRYGRAPRDWRFASDALGKPWLAEPKAESGVRFSLSHTDGLVAVALCEGFDIGVDAEAMKARSDLSEVAHECFSATEQAQLTQADAGFASDAERFYALWTLKEALLKAKGLGLNQPPNTFSVDLRSMRVAVPKAIEPAHEWQLACRKATADHFVSVALDAPHHMRDVVFSVIGTGSS
jgi:4'-phosphopantetheinyl transferase